MEGMNGKSRIRSTMKLLLSSLLAITMVIGMLNLSAFKVKAVEGDAEDKYTIYFENDRPGWTSPNCFLWKGTDKYKQVKLELCDEEKNLYKVDIYPSEGYEKILFSAIVGDGSGLYELPGQDALFKIGKVKQEPRKQENGNSIVEFVNTLGWDDVYIYTINGLSIAGVTSDWPGEKMELVDQENGIYRYVLDGSKYKWSEVIINNGAGKQAGLYNVRQRSIRVTPIDPEGWVIEKKEDNLKIVEEWGNLYCEDQDGNRVYGLQTVDGDLYYFGEVGDGMMKFGLYYVDGMPYYFGEDGKAPKSRFVTPYYDTYYFDADGKAHTGWLELDGEKYYADARGTILKGVQTIDEKTYLFNRNDGGKMVRNTMAHDWWGDHYYGDDGVMQTGFITFEDKTYYFFENGDMAHGWQTIDGNTYFFGDNDGIMAKGTTFIYWRDYEFDENGVLQE